MKLVPLLLAGLGASAALAAAEPDGKGHWAFQAPVRPPEPKVRNASWVRTPIDRFILAALEKRKLTPSPEAERSALLRRVTFDLLGLPPTPEELVAFLADDSPQAYDKVVERLLASPHYGERWGRHWLDIVAYADSNGYFSADSERALAWKYRDYVVRSINADKPLDRFVREQLAGDELAGYAKDGDVTPDMEELLVATHLLRNAPDGTGESDGNAAELRADRYAVLEGNVQILGSAFLGLTVQCARCHNHKFEPVTQDDYYGLQAILKPVYDHDHWLKPSERLVTMGTRAEREANRQAIQRSERELKAAQDSIEGLIAPYRKLVQQEMLEKLPETLRGELRKAIDAKEKDRTPAMKELLKTNDAVASIKTETLRQRFPELVPAADSLEAAIKKRTAERPAALPQLAVAVEVTPDPAPHQVLKRGNYADPLRPAPPRVPALFGTVPVLGAIASSSNNAAGSSASRASSGRRLAFADWLVSSQNPVFARLMINRIWQGHFGSGLVATTDNFGLTGARPTHPELLDWLATEFMASGYRVKEMHRLMVKSAVYRQASGLRAEALAQDPDDQLWWRFPLRRLDAESIRDAMLSVSGELETRLGGPAVPKDVTEEGQVVVNESKPGAHRRSLYLQQQRTRPVTFVDVFDGVKFNPNCVQRSTSTIALQSLAMMNSDFARARAAAFARRLLRETNSAEARVDLAFRLAVGRAPTPAERGATIDFFAAQTPLYEHDAHPDERVWADFGQMLMAGNAFLYLE